MDVKIDVSGDMDVGKSTETTTPQQNLSWTNLPTKIPNIKELLIQLRKNIRPFTEFLNVQNFKSFPSFQRLQGRVIRNLAYFQSNYICVFIILMLYCLITSPLILFIVAGVLFACHKIRQSQLSLAILGRKINTSQQCLIIMLAATPILYIVGVGAIMFWVLGASVFLITLHAAFYNIDAIVTEDTETFLSEAV